MKYNLSMIQINQVYGKISFISTSWNCNYIPRSIYIFYEINIVNLYTMKYGKNTSDDDDRKLIKKTLHIQSRNFIHWLMMNEYLKLNKYINFLSYNLKLTKYNCRNLYYVWQTIMRPSNCILQTLYNLCRIKHNTLISMFIIVLVYSFRAINKTVKRLFDTCLVCGLLNNRHSVCILYFQPLVMLKLHSKLLYSLINS